MLRAPNGGRPKLPAEVMLTALALLVATVAQTVAHDPYEWRQVPIGPLGFVTGMVIHPTARGVMYVRTDVGGLYGFDAANRTWSPLNDLLMRDDPVFRGGIESVALDRGRPERVYIASGDIYRSDDRGRTWRALGLRKRDGSRIYMGPNDPWRNVGERLAVDPNAGGRTLFFGSRRDGLWRSTDEGRTWSAAASFPSRGLDNAGISFVLFDPSSGTATEPSRTVVAGVVGDGVFRSSDSGATWKRLVGPAPDFQPMRGAIADDGTLYVSFMRGDQWTGSGEGAVFRYRGTAATDVTPPGFALGFCGVSVDPRNSRRVVVAPWPWAPDTSQITFQSEDAGHSWVNREARFEIPSWWVSYTPQNWNATVLIDPHEPNRLWIANGYGVYSTANSRQTPQRWTVVSDGVEELVGQHVRKPPGGPLLFAVCDKGGFTLERWDRKPDNRWDPGVFSYATSIDFAARRPNFVVRASTNSDNRTPTSSYSTDGGRTWTPMASVPPGGLFGGIAVSADNVDNIVFATHGENGRVFRTMDRGRTWVATNAPTRHWFNTVFAYQSPLAADRVDGRVFYLFGIAAGEFWRSDDGGASWRMVSRGVLPENWRAVIRPTPDRAREVWALFVGEPTESLWRSLDGGATWTRIARLDEVGGFGFGPSIEGGRPTVYLWGNVGGAGRGMYRSDNLASTEGDGASARWVKIDSDSQPIPRSSWNGVEADPDHPGRVFVSVGGRGLMVGERRR